MGTELVQQHLEKPSPWSAIVMGASVFVSVPIANFINDPPKAKDLGFGRELVME
jgi:hypothetical protein